MITGFVGLGVMGRPMASNLVKHGAPTIVWNRTGDKAEVLRKEGADVASSLADVGRQADVVITMLAGDDSVEEVVFGNDGLAAHMPKVA